MPWNLPAFDLLRALANVLLSRITLTSAGVTATRTSLALALAQVADELALELAAGECVDRQVDRFVTHMPLGVVRPVGLQSGGDLLGRPALGEHPGDHLEQLGAQQQATLAARSVAQRPGPGHSDAHIIVPIFSITA